MGQVWYRRMKKDKMETGVWDPMAKQAVAWSIAYEEAASTDAGSEACRDAWGEEALRALWETAKFEGRIQSQSHGNDPLSGRQDCRTPGTEPGSRISHRVCMQEEGEGAYSLSAGEYRRLSGTGLAGDDELPEGEE